MLSTIIVNKQNTATGQMEKSTLGGFIAAAEILGYNIVDPEGFHRQQREACFAWAKGES